MKGRCTDERRPDYVNYGARGISYDQSWEQFEVFLSDMGDPGRGKTLDRIDNGKGYSKANCRWATRAEQARNKRNVVLYEWNGERRSVADWARVTGIQRLTLRYRLKAGWPIERALTEPVK